MHTEDGTLQVERHIDVTLPVDELWELIGTRAGWQRWLVDHAAVDVVPGAAGDVVDDGERRSVRVLEVDADRGVTFEWESEDRPGDRSTVTLRIVDDPDGRRLHVTETWDVAATDGAACAECPVRAGLRWDLRECVLCLGALAACPA